MIRLATFLSFKGIEYSFYLLFFLVPLILTPLNYELFEYNKMMLIYAFAVVIGGSWLIKIILQRKLILTRTPLDLPLLLFLLSQIISTIFSIDPHVSLFGYYSRFNGGLLSTISYLILYYAFVSNFPKEKIKKLLFIILSSGFVVSVYGILEHFGIDKDIWVQDVQNRVFSTLGQPNWLAAYLGVLIPITMGIFINSKFEIRNSKKYQNPNDRNVKHFDNLNLENSNLFRASGFVLRVLSIIFYITLLFTKSRSGFLGFWIANILFSAILLSKFKMRILKSLLIFNFSFLIFNFIFGAPFGPINRFTLPEITKSQKQTIQDREQAKPLGSSIIDVGITESGTIRRIVWKGAIEVFKHYPLIGSGVETFAFSYYQFRPVEHNLTSEWDFLYNKAHNEYLNYAANTGVLGLGSYLLIIAFFVWWFLRSVIGFQLSVVGLRLVSFQFVSLKPTDRIQTNQIPKTENRKLITAFQILTLTLFTGWLSIIITNFFGFSVVIVQLFFFLIPTISFVLFKENTPDKSTIKQIDNLPRRLASLTLLRSGQAGLTINKFQQISITLTLFLIFYILYLIFRFWYADVLFARGYHAARSQEYIESYKALREAILVNNREPFYYDEFSAPASQLAVAFAENNQSTESAQLVDEAIKASSLAVQISPRNVNFWKTRTRVFYTLSQIDDKYLQDALEALKISKTLSPTDPKITYNMAIIYQTIGKMDEAFTLLDETIKLKADYRDAYFAKAILYEQDKKIEKAREALSFILEKINPSDEEARAKLEELK